MVNFLPKGTTNSFFENKVDTLSEKEKTRRAKAAREEEAFAAEDMKRRMKRRDEIAAKEMAKMSAISAIREGMEDARYLDNKKKKDKNMGFTTVDTRDSYDREKNKREVYKLTDKEAMHVGPGWGVDAAIEIPGDYKSIDEKRIGKSREEARAAAAKREARRIGEEAEALRKRIEEADYLKIKKNTTGNKRPELDA
jgi:hypothetical protein